MKLLILEDSSRANLGGGQKVTLHTLKALKKYEQIIVADCSNKTLFAKKIKKEFKLIQLQCNNRHTNKIIRILTNILFILFVGVNVIKIKLQKPDLIYSATRKNLLLAYLINTFLKIPYVHHAHLVENKKNLAFYMLKPAYKKAKTVICVSNCVAQSINTKNTTILYNPTQIKQNQYKTLNKGRLIITSLSSYTSEKGVIYLAKAAKKLFEENFTDFEMHFYGNGPLKNKLQQYIQYNVQVHEFTQNVDKVLRKTDLLVLPSTIKEAAPMTILEALSYGIPVITTNIGGQAELVKGSKAGILVKTKDETQIANSIIKLYNDNNMYEELSKNAIKFAKKNNETKYSQKIRKIILKAYESTPNK